MRSAQIPDTSTAKLSNNVATSSRLDLIKRNASGDCSQLNAWLMEDRSCDACGDTNTAVSPLGLKKAGGAGAGGARRQKN